MTKIPFDDGDSGPAGASLDGQLVIGKVRGTIGRFVTPPRPGRARPGRTAQTCSRPRCRIREVIAYVVRGLQRAGHDREDKNPPPRFHHSLVLN